MVMDLNGHGSFLIGSEKYHNMAMDKVDPMYKYFLEHLREDGKSYVLETEDGDGGSSVLVRYEQEDMSKDFPDVDPRINSGQNSFAMNGALMNKKSTFRKTKPKPSAAITFLASQAESRLLTDSYVGHPSCSPEIRTPWSALDKSDARNIQVENNVPDDSYQEFLSFLKVRDGFMVMEYNSVSIIYEGSEPTASENLAVEVTFSGSGAPAPSKSSQPTASFKHTTRAATCSKVQEALLCGSSEITDLIIYEGDNRSIAHLEPCNSSEYDTKLRRFISKPYDQHEHEELWEQAKFRDQVVRHKVLRNQCKSFKTTQMGLSYLDHFPDLASKLEHADPHEALRLLRGFFFWLKNLCHEGAYRPWVSAVPEMVEVSDHDAVLPAGEQQMETEESSAVVVL